MPTRIDVHHVDAYYHDTRAVEGVTLSFEPGEVAALIGPSGCGKTTFLRTLNRMHEVVSGARVRGSVRMDGIDLYGRDIDPTAVRRQIGMVFQRPNPFPSMSIYDNVIAGFRIAGIRRSRSEFDEIVEGALRAANLWTEVAHRLRRSGASLSGGQQQRLCIARAIAIRPSVLLMDEPCSSLDPLSTRAVEELIVDLKSAYTVVIVTHNMQQAERISDKTAFFNVADQGMPGRLVEYGPTPTMFSNPGQQATRDYIEGRFG